MADQFCLKWNNYQLSLTSAFKHILEEEEFVDVTLSAGGKNLKAHKVVLSACSSYFRDLLKGIGLWQHPVLVLRDVQFLELQSILEFVYLGEVNVEQDRLESFLKTAELLRIKGLTDGLGEKKQERPPPVVTKPAPPPVVKEKTTTPPKLPILKPASVLKNNNTKRSMTALTLEDVFSRGEMIITPPKESPEPRPAKTLKLDDVIIPQHSSDNEINYDELTEDDIEENGEHIVVAGDPVTTEDFTNIGDDFSDTDSYKDLNIAEDECEVKIGADGKEFLGPLHKRCPHCQMVMLKKNLSRHIRDQHSMDRPRSTCPICTKSYKTPDWLKDHVRRGHGYTKEATDELLAKMKLDTRTRSPVISPVKTSASPASTVTQATLVK